MSEKLQHVYFGDDDSLVTGVRNLINASKNLNFSFLFLEILKTSLSKMKEQVCIT